MRAAKPPVGSSWRVLAHGRRKSFSVQSKDYPPGVLQHREARPEREIFDELVIDRWFHLEQMDTRLWFLAIGEDKVMIEIGKDGSPKMGPWYR